MLDLYTWRTPNGKKAPILLAELGWPFELHLVNLGQGDQNKAHYLAINPNGKIPALVDTEASCGELVVVFESGAILEYLADKAGQLSPEGPARAGRGPVVGLLAGRGPRAVLRSDAGLCPPGAA